MAAPQFYFAWVDHTDTTWSNAFKRFDERVLSFELELKEGQIPLLTIVIPNPGVGILAPSRKRWAWFAFDDGAGTVTKLFFGQVVGVTDRQSQFTTTVRLIARREDWLTQKYEAAEALKVAPYWDPIFQDAESLINPDAVLEGYPASWHVDAVTGAWTASDNIVGEDGTVVFTGDQIISNSLKTRILNVPLRNLKMKAKVAWHQIDSGGCVNLCPYGSVWAFKTYAGASLIEEWPKTGSSIGGGWYVSSGYAVDMWGISTAQNYSASGELTIDGPHVTGDATSISVSTSGPMIQGQPISICTASQTQNAIIDDSPDGQSQPNASGSETYLIIPEWLVAGNLYLQYRADRERKEEVFFTLTGDLQYTEAAPTVQEETAVKELNSVDIGQPLLTPRAWTLLAGTSVQMGQIVKPNNPTGPDGTSYQIALNSGTLGLTQPTFSDIIGDTTVDGGVTWACIGDSLPKVPGWAPSTMAALGTVIAPVPPLWTWYSAYIPPIYPARLEGEQFSEGTVIRSDLNGSFQICIIGGTSSVNRYPAFNPVYGAVTVEGSVTWVSLGTYLPGGCFQICTQAGQTGLLYPPPFSPNYGDEVTDGTAKWKSLGFGGPSISIPVGGVPGRVTARWFYPSDRGKQALEYLIMRARAEILTKARAVEVSFQVRFTDALSLSLRKNATVPWVGTATATGKITRVLLKGSGDSAGFSADVTIACAVGNGGTVSGASGSPTYASSGYVASGYQQMSGSTVLVGGGSDVGYTPPAPDPSDDGLNFPLDYFQVVLLNAIVGNENYQHSQIMANINRIIWDQARYDSAFGPGATYGERDAILKALAVNGMLTLDALMTRPGMSIYPEIMLKPVTGQGYNNVYKLDVTTLKVAKQIDLAVS